MAVVTTERFFEESEMSRYLTALPWERWLINRARRQQGLPPFVLRDVRAYFGPGYLERATRE